MTGKTMRKQILVVVMAVATLFGAQAGAGDWNKGVAAFDAGDFETAYVEFSDFAEQGYAGAQYGLGFMYFSGNGVTQNYTEAVKWFTLAAKQGNAGAQYGLGAMYYDGNGVVQNYVLAHVWLNLAVANGVVAATAARDVAAQKMTQADIVTAQRMASECMASNYENCGY